MYISQSSSTLIGGKIQMKYWQLQLVQMAPEIIRNIEDNDDVIDNNLQRYIVKEITKRLLQNIGENFRLVDIWQHGVTKVLFFSNKLSQARMLLDLQLLRIVNDLIKTIPLSSIKEIIQLGLDSSKQVILTEKFIYTILDKLDKLEQKKIIYLEMP